MSDYEDDDFEQDLDLSNHSAQKEEPQQDEKRSWLNPQERSHSRFSGASRHSSSRSRSPSASPSRSKSASSRSSSRSSVAATPEKTPKKAAVESPRKPPPKATPVKVVNKPKDAPIEAAVASPLPVKAVHRDADRHNRAEAARALLPAKGERSRSSNKPAVPTSEAPPPKPTAAPKAVPTAKDLASLQLKNIELEVAIAQIREQLNALAPQIIRPRKTMSAPDTDRVTKLQREAKALQTEHDTVRRKIDGATNVSKIQNFIEAKEKEVKELRDRNKWLEREIRLNSRKLKSGFGNSSVHGGHETNVSIDQQKARVAEECKTEASVWANTLERSKMEAESAVETRERLEMSVEALTASDKAPTLWKTLDARQVVDLHEKIQIKLENCQGMRQRLRSVVGPPKEAEQNYPKTSEVDDLRKQVAGLRKRIARDQEENRSPSKATRKAPPPPPPMESANGPIAGRRARAAKEAASTQGDVTPKKPLGVTAPKAVASKPAPKQIPAKKAVVAPKKEAPPVAPVAVAASPEVDSPSVSSRGSTPASSRASSPIPSSNPSPTKMEKRSPTPVRSPTPPTEKSSKVSSKASSAVSSRASSVPKSSSRHSTPPRKSSSPSAPSTPVAERRASTALSSSSSNEHESVNETNNTKEEPTSTPSRKEEVIEEEVVEDAPVEDEEPSWL